MSKQESGDGFFKDNVRFGPRGNSIHMSFTMFRKLEENGSYTVNIPSFDLCFVASSESEIQRKLDLHWSVMMHYYMEHLGGVGAFMAFLKSKGFSATKAPMTTHYNVSQGKNNKPAKIVRLFSSETQSLQGYESDVISKTHSRKAS